MGHEYKPRPLFEIEDVLEVCDQSEGTGASKFPALTYEDGVAAGLRWMTRSGGHPINEQEDG